ncbi:linker for activation of T-cells family member 2 isoform X2 [Pteropus alecto]|uniref:linker for activation of T-cells family member 2 isoform X2 n=1 Tax=Pteropus alecto TaxID=9402 RepID=UPI000D537988|nr:linker for activation of T-cells family member 2 isoform X2 [Pteropus alecto]
MAAPPHSHSGVFPLSVPCPYLSISPISPSLSCARPGPRSAQCYVFTGKRMSRTLWWPGPIPWLGRPGQVPWWTQSMIRHQQGRTSSCVSPPVFRILHPPGTRTSAKEADMDQRQPTYDEDSNSYENVLICKQKQPESGDEGSEDYQNSASIEQWRESRRVMERVPREAPSSPAGSPDEDDGEPDYVNKDIEATEA